FAALFVGIFVALNPRRAAIGGIIYALLEGYLLGAISAASTRRPRGSSAPPSWPPSACSWPPCSSI
ncbi:MAG: hypothetical protein ABW310_00530, partial [Acidimicrobiales bacterium]